MKKVGIYQQEWNVSSDFLYWLGLMAKILSEQNEVEIVAHDLSVKSRMEKALGEELTEINVRVVDSPDWQRYNSSLSFKTVSGDYQEISAPYDLFFNASNELPIFCKAKKGVLVTEFPETVFEQFWKHNFSERKNSASFWRKLFSKNAESVIWSNRLTSYQKHWCFSDFTRQWCGQRWKIFPKVMAPACRPDWKVKEKKPLIVVWGNFSCENRERYDVAINAFQDFVDKMVPRFGLRNGWKMSILGEFDGREENRNFLERLRRKSYGYPIEFVINPDWKTAADCLTEAQFLWSAKGYGANERQPERLEHSGMKILQAQSAGVIPIVFHAGCVAEVINHGMNGFLCSNYREIIDFTSAIVIEGRILSVLEMGALDNAKKFDEKRLRKTLSGELGSVLNFSERKSK